MRIRPDPAMPLIFFVSFILVGCSSDPTSLGSAALPLTRIAFSGSSQQQGVERIYFTVGEGEPCAVRMRREEGQCFLSFVRISDAGESDLPVKVAAEDPWIGSSYVDIPIADALSEQGGDWVILAEDSHSAKVWAELSYPPR